MESAILHKSGGMVKDVDMKTRTITGYFSVFGNKDSDGDIILPGAYKKSIDERGPSGKNRILHLWMHDTWQVLAKPGILKEDETGLYFESCFPDDDKQTALQRDALKLYDQGILTEHSVGFQIEKWEQDQPNNCRLLKELKLWEGSTVTWGANELAKVCEVKSIEKPALIDRMARIIKALRDGHFTEDTFNALEYELTILKTQIDSLDSKQPEKPLPTTEPGELINFFKSKLK